MLNTVAPSFLAQYLIGHCTVFFASRPVSTPSVTAWLPANARSDVYSYNFPDDRRWMKALGTSSGFVSVLSENSQAFLISILRLSSGDCPNSSDGRGRLLLVHGWIRQHGTPQEF